MEKNSETASSLDFAKDCGYISTAEHGELTALSKEIGKMLGTMIKAPGSFLTSGLRSPTSDSGILLPCDIKFLIGFRGCAF